MVLDSYRRSLDEDNGWVANLKSFPKAQKKTSWSMVDFFDLEVFASRENSKLALIFCDCFKFGPI